MAFIAYNKSKEVTQKQQNFIPKLKVWLESLENEDDFFNVGISPVREKYFYVALLEKILVLGEYSYNDGEFLNKLTQHYFETIRPIGKKRV
jgi:hypothetical protein